MMTVRLLGITAVFVLFGGCSDSSKQTDDTLDQGTSANSNANVATPVTTYPILQYSRTHSSDVLAQHAATDKEKQLFQRMDSAVVALQDDPDLDMCYAAIIPIGAEAGLNEEQSIAFWTRMTFSEFEP